MKDQKSIRVWFVLGIFALTGAGFLKPDRASSKHNFTESGSFKFEHKRFIPGTCTKNSRKNIKFKSDSDEVLSDFTDFEFVRIKYALIGGEIIISNCRFDLRPGAHLRGKTR